VNESSVSSPFMKQLRAALPGAVVVKHHDASMIGLPDCSVHWGFRVMWLEFKLLVPGLRGGWFKPEKVATDSPVQHQMMCRLGQQCHAAWYVFWVKKSKRIVVWDPLRAETIHECETTPQLVEFISSWLRSR
jgi:hypothetical protein